MPLLHSIGGVVQPYALEMSVFLAHGVRRELGEGAVHDDGPFVMVEAKGNLSELFWR